MRIANRVVRRMVLLLVVISACLIAVSQNLHAETGLQKIADNVYSYLDTKGASPKNSFGANAGIVIGRDGILVVDTLISAKEARRFINEIRTISDKPIKYVVDTHSHLDHAFGNSEFEKTGATVVGHVNSRRDLKINGDATMARAKAYGLTDDDLEGTTIALPKITFTDKMEIDLGDQTVSLIYTEPSHTDGSIMVYLPDKKVLFAGDILFTDYHPNLIEGNISGWTRTLDYIMGLEVDKIVPGHGPLSGKKDVSDMKEYLLIFDKKARELCARSRDADRVTDEIKKYLPQRRELEMIIKGNIQRKYLKRRS